MCGISLDETAAKFEYDPRMKRVGMCSRRRAEFWRSIGSGIALLLLCACTGRQAYEGIQQGNRNACLERPPPQQAECMEAANISYEEYERRRKEATRAPE
jgi:hypothetical protein